MASTPSACRTHPQYQGSRAPRADCAPCRAIFEARHQKICKREGCGKRVTNRDSGVMFCSAACGNLNRRATTEKPTLDIRRDAEAHALREELGRYRTAYKDAVVATDHEQRLVAALDAVVAKFPAVPRDRFLRPLMQTEDARGHEEPVLLLGDLHIGEVISRHETHGINAYDFDIFLARLEHLEARVLDILTVHQQGRFDALTVLGLGDFVSGVIHEELEKWGAIHVIDQVYLGGLAVALLLYRLLTLGGFRRLRYVSVSGNHGRIKKGKPESKVYYKNFDYLFNSVIALALANVPDIEIEIPRAIFTVTDVAGSRILVSHGHEVPPSSLGLPLYSINRASAQYQELLAVAKQGRYDYWVLGHTHRPAELDNCIVNGCLSGINEFGIGRNFKPIMPLQKLLGFHSRHGLAWEYRLRFTDAPEQPSVYAFDVDRPISDTLADFRSRITA